MLLDLLVQRISHLIQQIASLLLKIQLTKIVFLYLLLVETPGKRNKL